MSMIQWQRTLACRLVRHACAVLRPTRPLWASAMERELEHIPTHFQTLVWALGCVRASYMERYFRNFRPALYAFAVGVAFAATDELLTGVLAARPYPHWYLTFAKAHRHLSLELWSVIALTLPVALIAAGFGAMLARIAKVSALTLPFVSLSAWALYALLPLPALYDAPLRLLWEAFVLWPTSTIAGIILPGCGFVLGYRLARPRPSYRGI